MGRNIFVILLISVLLGGSLLAKPDITMPEIDSIDQMLCEIADSRSDKKKDELNSYLIEFFQEFLKSEESFSADYDSVKYLSVLDSDDKNLRVITWNLNYKDGSFKYFGFLQYKNKKNYMVHFLDDKKFYDDSFERHYQTNSEWYGALYYDLVTTKWNSRTYYTLIGWDGADFLINRKVVEVLTFDRRGMPSFGKKSFKLDKLYAGRLVFEYADRATMLLRYNDKQEMLVLDHLSPPEQKFKGLYQYYGPDFSYDAFVFRAGKWYLQSDIDPEKAINFERNGHVNSLKRRGHSNRF